ncbi:LysE family translocator [Microbacterium sp. cx-59]|uniref:LysE family translocator n=1 Tax=Microbacterium sp. cx-59 TaxID=2891207 RepID=UPI001E5966D2|nr:LysE family translocator [Microbacterium sp. cx-59]MCC4907715.1 LysE family translocator [Microbacterium sp. cx-59]
MVPDVSVMWSFALVVGLLTITPGLDTALVLRTATVSGRRRAWGVITGIQTGTIIWGVLAATGVSAILFASQIAYDVLRIVGAGYLLWIGGRMIYSAIRPSTTPGVSATAEAPSSDSLLAGWRLGFTTNLLNPKMGAFYIALLPQFIPATAPQISWAVCLALVHVLIGITWLTFLLLLARSFRRWFACRSMARALDAIAGTVIVGFGLRIALEKSVR